MFGPAAERLAVYWTASQPPSDIASWGPMDPAAWGDVGRLTQ